ncbi:MAG: glutathione S-transferase family protein [Hyphomicrobium sp.]
MMEIGDNLTLYELAAGDARVRFSPHCWKIRMALAHKGLEAQCVPWRFSEKDIIAFSSQDRVPVLVHNQTVISDSWMIALYLEEQFPDRPSLFGPAETVPLTRFINSWTDATLVPALARIILLNVYDCLDVRDRVYFRSSREARFGMPMEEVVADQAARVGDLRKALIPLRQLLATEPFVSGSMPAYADYCIFGLFMWAFCTSSIALLETDDPVFAWRERLFEAFGGMAKRTARANQAHPC